jgi:hypothetical protein
VIIDTKTCKPELKAAFIEKLLLSGWKRVRETNQFYWSTESIPRC